MDARSIDDAGARLVGLRHEVIGDFTLAALAMTLSLGAAHARHDLALPLFVGGAAVGMLGIRALWRRWDLIDRLVGDESAYVIPEVGAYASRETSMERRHRSAELIRTRLGDPHVEDTRAAAELEALASELDDADLTLAPRQAVACMRLLSDVVESPLLNPDLPCEDLHARVCQIRSGFRQVAPALAAATHEPPKRRDAYDALAGGTGRHEPDARRP
jgi:hypothetical protein